MITEARERGASRSVCTRDPPEPKSGRTSVVWETWHDGRHDSRGIEERNENEVEERCGEGR